MLPTAHTQTSHTRVSVLFEGLHGREPRAGRGSGLPPTEPQPGSSAIRLECEPSDTEGIASPQPASFPRPLETLSLPPPTFRANLAVTSTLNQALAQKKITPFCSDESLELIVGEWQGWLPSGPLSPQ